MLAPVAAGVPATYETPWLVALGAGLVVLVVVALLLHRLLHVVTDIDRGVHAVWGAATRVAGDTATTWQLDETGDTLERMAAETRAHAELLAQD